MSEIHSVDEYLSTSKDKVTTRTKEAQRSRRKNSSWFVVVFLCDPALDGFDELLQKFHKYRVTTYKGCTTITT